MNGHRHAWELTWEHRHGTFVIAEEHRCSICPAVRRSKVHGQDCPGCPPNEEALA